MTNFIKDIMEVLEQYFVYIYPGFISLYVYRFSVAKGLKSNKETLFISVVVSYIYIIFYRAVKKVMVADFEFDDYIILFAIAVIVPVILHWVIRSKRYECFLNSLGFNTSVEDNVWDYIHYRDKEKKGIVLKIFLDEKGVLYEGSLRYHESDKEKEQVICLSGYRKYIKKRNKFVKKQDYSGDDSRWVMIKMDEIKRVEILYDSKK